MRLFRIPSSVSKYLVFATMGSVVAATAYVTYERVVNRNPMRLRKDAEGVYHWMTYEEHLEDLLRSSQEKLAKDPSSSVYQYMVAGYTVALEKERRKNAAARGGVDQRPLSDDDLKL